MPQFMFGHTPRLVRFAGVAMALLVTAAIGKSYLRYGWTGVALSFAPWLVLECFKRFIVWNEERQWRI